MKAILKLLFALTMIGSAVSHADTALSQDDTARSDAGGLVPSCHFERALCGYLDQNGETAIAPRFDWVDDFSEGRARVRSEGYYGFIDRSGDLVVPTIYDLVSTYWNGVAQVRRNGRTGLLDRQGNVVVPADYDVIIPLNDQNILVGTGGQLQELRRLEFRSPSGLPKGNYSFLNMRTGKATDPILAKVRFLMAALGSRLWLEVGGGFYLADTDGRRLSETFDYGGALLGDRAVVMRNRRYGAVNADGKVIIPLRFDGILGFVDKWAVFREGPLDGKYGYIDRGGEVMIDARFDSASPFENDVATVMIRGNVLQINRAGEVIGGKDGCQDGLGSEKYGRGHRVVGPDGQSLNGETYSTVDLNCGEPTLVCKAERQCGYLRDDGTLVGDRYFWRAMPFYDGVAGVLPTENEFAIIDRHGNFVLEPIRPKVRISYFGNGRVGFTSNGGRTLIDRQTAAALAVDPLPLLWEPDEPARCPRDSVAIVREGASITFRDKFGDPFIQGRLDYAACFAEGVAWVAFPDRQQWCQITKSGSVLSETCRCEQPLLSIKLPHPRPADSSCYEHGLEIVRSRDRQNPRK